ncbi:MAG: 4-phosphoerythronate dehydrogenase [Acidobacteria bacterium]|nr:4-phosphoerythronate dehydrogenase [Acidobacteriota bacterium]
MAGLVILADENIPFARDAFGTLGDVRLKHGRQIAAADLRDVDVLVVRSITRVDASLVAGTKVRFVGTATSGSDHVVFADLDRHGITAFTALGCNANAVAEYMAAAWLTIARRTGLTLRGLCVGVVGVGHVGSLVVEKARALGMIPVLNDPPKARESGRTDYRPLDELADCDIVTLHTPLTVDGPDPTRGLIGARFLSRLKKGAWLCSTGRGGVVDEDALHGALDAARLGACILDVWDYEPAIDGRLLGRVDIATPHIAGYSLEGKMNGTAMTYEAACRFFGVEPTWSAEAAAPPPTVPYVTEIAGGRRDEDVLTDVVSAVYPVLRDDAALRATAALDAAARGRAFDDLRKTYPTRREFRYTTVSAPGASRALLASLRALQFRIARQA